MPILAAIAPQSVDILGYFRPCRMLPTVDEFKRPFRKYLRNSSSSNIDTLSQAAFATSQSRVKQVRWSVVV